MGTHDTNDDGAMGLNLGPTNIDGEGVLDDPFDFDFVGTTPPTGHTLPGGYVMPSKVPSVIADEQRMADVFREAMLAVAALRSGCGLLDEVSRGMGNQPRYRTSLLMEAAADSLESAIARANGGAE